MNQHDALNIFRHWDKQGRYVYTKHELTKLFLADSPKTFTEGLARLVKSGLLKRPARGVYLYNNAHSVDGYAIEHIAKALRPGCYNYISLESALSEYGAISQIPIDRLTLITTGRSGTYETPFGVIEFTHTKRPVSDIINNIQTIKHRPLRIATKATAWRDLKRVGRNINMVNEEELQDD
jgi:hypothetical protein